MRALVQRVSRAAVHIEGRESAAIGTGLLILVGVEEIDDQEDIDWLVRKIIAMRIFGDEQGNMNYSTIDVKGQLLVVSQFTLHASVKKGNRPNFMRAAKPAKALELYQLFIAECKKRLSEDVFSGEFGANMQVELVNDGPVTIILDSHNRDM